MTQSAPKPQPPSRQDLKRQLREQKAIAKANRNWFARHKILTGIGAVIVLVVVASMVNQAGGPKTATPAGAAAPAAASNTNAGGSKSEAPAAAPGISNGDHVVGTEFAAGQYRAEVEESVIALCTVSQSDGDKVMDVRNANEGSVIFTVKDKAGTVVSFSGCSNIGLAADSIRPNPSTITNGDWLVGPELAPGQYKGVVDTDSPIKLGTITQTSKTGDVMDIRNANEGSVVFTVKESAGSVVSFSGFKEIQKTG